MIMALRYVMLYTLCNDCEVNVHDTDVVLRYGMYRIGCTLPIRFVNSGKKPGPRKIQKSRK